MFFVVRINALPAEDIMQVIREVFWTPGLRC